MKWQKIGHIFNSKGQFPWMMSHAAYPVAQKLDGALMRIYFSCRDKDQRSSIASLVIDINCPNEILDLSQEPLLSPGDKGYFDDSGVTVASIIENVNGSTYMYYLGWNLAQNVPFRNSIGLAIKASGSNSFVKYSTAPLLDRNQNDPITLSYPWVLKEGKKWHMWYGSHQTWSDSRFGMLHVLKYAESNDGINWQRSADPLLNLETERGEFAMSRPCIIHHQNEYKMWFSSRLPDYRIGFAISRNGKDWIRADETGALSPSEEGWDSQCVEYTSIFEHDERLYMLYNGNGYGATGFGLAVQINE